jgi:ATP-dependent DNA helicase RecG
METHVLSAAQVNHLLAREEGHFLDHKSIGISAAKLTRSLSAFANADGGELLVGIAELSRGKFAWQGFTRIEDANGHIQHLEETFPYGGDFEYEFLSAGDGNGFVLRITVLKTRDLRQASNGILYVRRGPQNLPVKDDAKIRDLARAKGLISHEDETLGIPIEEITNSLAILGFVLEIIPESEPAEWLRKQRMIVNDLPTVAGALLFSDEPQIGLPKADVKIYRYKTAAIEGSRETLVFDPVTVEGNLYNQISEAVATTVRLTEQIQKMTDGGLINIAYPREALHEVITNALLHRDYSHNDDVHVRIFDNRIEVESPGRLPAHITPANILSERFARNQTIVRIINKFPDAPNKDVGEGLNTAFAAMEKLRLRRPEIIEKDNSVLVLIRHESLASPEQQIVEYLRSNDTINNAKAREITGVQTDHQIRRAFKKLARAKEIEQVPGTERATTKYRLPDT